MKPSLIIALLLAYSIMSVAQIQLEETYDYSGTLSEIDDGEFKYYIMDVPLNQCRLYNEDHSLYKTLGLSVPAGYYLNDIKYISRRTFNSDDYIEILFIYYKIELINSQSVYTYGLKVVNENGSVLLNLPNGGFAEIKEGSMGSKLLTYQYIWNDSYYLVQTNVYTLGGSSKSTNDQLSQNIRIFPNPVEEYVYIYPGMEVSASDGFVRITDMLGRCIIDHPFPPGSQRISIPATVLPAGSYLVNICTSSGLRESEKIQKK